jgi:hypothetical protein
VRIRTAILPCLALAAVTSAAAQEATAVQPPAAPGSKWEWTIAPYLWGAGVSLDVDANGNPVLGGDASFKDLLHKLDIGGMLHFEARHGKAGLLADALYISLSDQSHSSGNPPIPNGTMVDTHLTMGIYELGGFYRPGGRSRGFDILFGGRLVDVNQDSDVTFPGPLGVMTTIGGSKNYVDAFAGVRTSVAMGRRWDFIARGDVAAGGTDFTWNAVASFGFKFDKAGKYTLTAGYRAMHLDLGQTTDGGTEVTSKMTLSGPVLGFLFRF